MTSGDPKEDRYRVQAVERALDILDAFSMGNQEMSLTELVSRTGLNKTTAKRLLSNLVSRGYLQQDKRTKHYHLGLRLFELGGIVFSSFDLRKSASYAMNRLQGQTGATVLLGIAMEDQLVYIGKREGRTIRVSSDIGWRRPLHYGMLGMILMAFLDSKRVKEILEHTPLEAYTPYSITDEDAFRLRLEKIRAQGYMVEKEEAMEGIVGIAAPIRNYSREVIAALGIALPVSTTQLKNGFDKHIALVRECCDSISADLGYLKI